MPRKVDTPYRKKSASRLNIRAKKKSNQNSAPSFEEDENAVFSPFLVEENSWSTFESAQTLTGRPSEPSGAREMPSAIPEEEGLDGEGDGDGVMESQERADPLTPPINRDNLAHADNEDGQEKEVWRETPTNAPSARIREFMAKQLNDSPLVHFVNTSTTANNLALSEVECCLEGSPKEPSLFEHTPVDDDIVVPMEKTGSQGKKKTPRRNSQGGSQLLKVPEPPAKVKKTRSVTENIQKSAKESNQTDESSSDLPQDKDDGGSRRCYSLSSFSSFQPIISSTPSMPIFSKDRSNRRREHNGKFNAKLFTPPSNNKVVDNSDAAKTPKQRKHAVCEGFDEELRGESRKRKMSMENNRNSSTVRKSSHKSLIPREATTSEAVGQMSHEELPQSRESADPVWTSAQSEDDNAAPQGSVHNPINCTTNHSTENGASIENDAEIGVSHDKTRKVFSPVKKVNKRRSSQNIGRKSSTRSAATVVRQSNHKKKLTSEESAPSTSNQRGEDIQYTVGAFRKKAATKQRRKSSKQRQTKEPELNDSELILLHEEEGFDCYTIGPSVVAYAPLTSSDGSLDSSAYDIQLPLCPISAMREKFLNVPYQFPPL